MFRIVRLFLETLSPWSDASIARRERREVRRVIRDERKEETVDREIEGAFGAGERQRIQEAYEHYRKMMEHEIADFKHILREYKILSKRVLDDVQNLSVALTTSSSAAAAGNLQKWLEKVQEINDGLEKDYKTYIGELAAFSSTNLSLRQLLDEASQLKDLYFQTREMRKHVRGFSKAMKREISDERAGKRLTEQDREGKYKAILEAWASELRTMGRQHRDVVMLLQSLHKKVERHVDKLHDRLDTHYPEAWAEENIRELRTIERDLKTFIDDEIGKARLFLSKIEHHEVAA